MVCCSSLFRNWISRVFMGFVVRARSSFVVVLYLLSLLLLLILSISQKLQFTEHQTLTFLSIQFQLWMRAVDMGNNTDKYHVWTLFIEQVICMWFIELLISINNNNYVLANYIIRIIENGYVVDVNLWH